MNLYRFGGAAIRLDSVVGIREIAGEAGAQDATAPSAPSPARVEVFYEGCDSVIFEGPDAAALRAFVAALPDPLAAPDDAFSGNAGGPIDKGSRRKPGG
jgi:hypothetical protein